MTTQNYLNQPGDLSEREMLVFAAKAGGIADGDVFYDMSRDKEWNPLEDDGDALRLAVKLNIPVFPYDDETSTGTVGVVAKNWRSKEENTRRAITRAAAAIGEQMP